MKFSTLAHGVEEWNCLDSSRVPRWNQVLRDGAEGRDMLRSVILGRTAVFERTSVRTALTVDPHW